MQYVPRAISIPAQQGTQLAQVVVSFLQQDADSRLGHTSPLLLDRPEMPIAELGLQPRSFQAAPVTAQAPAPTTQAADSTEEPSGGAATTSPAEEASAVPATPPRSPEPKVEATKVVPESPSRNHDHNDLTTQLSLVSLGAVIATATIYVTRVIRR